MQDIITTPAQGETSRVIDELWQSIENSALLKTTELQPDIPQVIDKSGGLTMNYATNSTEGINQVLVGAVGAGNEIFGVIKAIDTRSGRAGEPATETYLITRMYPGQEDKRPTIVGVVSPGTELVVGRTQDPSYEWNVSRSHFSIDLGADGKLMVKDLDSTYGTHLVESAGLTMEQIKAAFHSEDDVAAKGLRRRIAFIKKKSPAPLSLENPFDDHSTWSAKSAAARMAVDSVKPSAARDSETMVFEPNSKRNRWLESVLDSDPSRPLPKVQLDKRPDENVKIIDLKDEGIRTGDPRDGTSVFDVKNEDGHNVGLVVLKKPLGHFDHVEDSLYIGDINIDGHHGYGPATYLEILKALPKDHKLRTEGVLSADAKKVWERFVDRGIAKRIGGPDASPAMYETIF